MHTKKKKKKSTDRVYGVNGNPKTNPPPSLTSHPPHLSPASLSYFSPSFTLSPASPSLLSLITGLPLLQFISPCHPPSYLSHQTSQIQVHFKQSRPLKTNLVSFFHPLLKHYDLLGNKTKIEHEFSCTTIIFLVNHNLVWLVSFCRLTLSPHS